jgi:hypothetical protein
MNETRDWRSQDGGDRISRNQERNRPRLFALRKPVSQVQGHSGEITCFRQPQKKAHDVQLMNTVNEARQHRDNSPDNQDSGDPHPCSNPVQQQIAGDFKEEVS